MEDLLNVIITERREKKEWLISRDLLILRGDFILLDVDLEVLTHQERLARLGRSNTKVMVVSALIRVTQCGVLLGHAQGSEGSCREPVTCTCRPLRTL